MDFSVATAVDISARGGGLELRLLGPLAVLRDGRELELPRSRKARAMLAVLALSPRPLSREQLCEMFWDGPADPRAELRGALSRLRALLDEPGRDRVRADGPGVQLDLTDVRIDVRALEAEVRGGPMPDAATRFEGEFLEGLEIQRAPAYGHWLLGERRRWRGLQVALLERQVDQLSADSDEALDRIGRWLRLLPHDRRAHERLLQALARRGRLREGDEHLAAAVRLFEAEGQDAAGLSALWRAARARLGAAAPVRALVAADAAAATAVVSASVPQEATAAPARHASVAVMPFEELPPASAGGFGRYLAHDVTMRLSKLRSLFVISPGSTGALDARGMGAEEAARVLDVDYVASGLLRRHGPRIALSVQLVHTRSARVVWADELHATAAEPFEVLEELGNQLVAGIAGQMELAERQRAVLKPPETLDAWEAHHRGLWHMYRFRREDNALARHWFELATRLEPSFSRPHAGLSFTHWQSAFQGWGDRERDTELAWRHANEGLLADERDPTAHWALGRAFWLRGRTGESLAALKQSVLLSPNFSQGHYALAFVQAQSGDAGAALAAADHARELSPFDPLAFAMLATRALALLRLGQADEAANWAVRATARPNAHLLIRGIAAHCLELAGRHDEALRLARAVREEQPGYRVDDFLAAFRFDVDGEQMMRRAAAGLGLD